MKATILDYREESVGKCYLCTINLEDYISSLPLTYQEYDIQREIVSNVYLDHLVDTVLSTRHIPPIVLVVENNNLKEKSKLLEITTYKILDGLQRTFRLKAIRATIDFCEKNLKAHDDYLSWSKFKLSKNFSTALHEFDSNTDILLSVLSTRKSKGKAGLLDTFSNNKQWFEVWTGLSPEEEVRKMLTLNAGHKPVKTRHQLELLFLNLLPMLRDGESSAFKIVREKNISAAQFSKSRECGSFHFAHLITSLLSFYEGKPIAPSTSLIQSIQANEKGIDEFGDFASPDFLKGFVKFLVRLDHMLDDQYPGIGVLWLGREVSLAGLFGALGAHSLKEEINRSEVMRSFLDLIKAHPKMLNLEQFERQRNALDLSKVNIGNVNRTAVYTAITQVLTSSNPSKVDWRRHFGADDK